MNQFAKSSSIALVFIALTGCGGSDNNNSTPTPTPTPTPTATIDITSISDDTGAADYLTSDTSLTINGTLTGTLGSGEKAQISVDNGTTWTDLVVNGSGNWNYVDGRTLVNGKSYTYKVRVIGAAGSEGSTDSQVVTIDTTAPTPTPTPTPALAFAGTWESTRCDLPTSSAFRLVAENYQTSNTSFDNVIDSVGYTETQCTGTTKADYEHDGVTSSIVVENIGTGKTYKSTTFYPAKIRARTSTTGVDGVLAFRDASTYCVLENTTTADPAAIDKTVQEIDLANTHTCWKKSSLKRFQREKPTTLISTTIYQMLDTQPTLQRLQDQLNTQSAAGYKLIEAGLETSTASTTASLLMRSDERQKRNIYSKDNATNTQKYTYHVVNGTGTTVTERYNAWKAQLSAQASQGYLYHSQQMVDLIDTDDLYNNIFEKRVGDTAIYTIDQKEVSRNSVYTTSTWQAIANEFGAAGCRLFFTQNVLNTKTAFFCANSNLHNGTYSYRFIPFPTTNNATAIKTILDAQKAEGYVYRYVAVLGGDSSSDRGMLFEKDSTQPNLAASIQYKVFNDGVLRHASTTLIDQNLSHQGLLGWHLWDGRVTIKESTLLNDAVERTIYSNQTR